MSRALSELRVALVHDWLVTLRGGERVLDALCELFPDAVVHTLVRKPGIGTPRIEAMRHATSFVDRLPLAHRHELRESEQPVLLLGAGNTAYAAKDRRTAARCEALKKADAKREIARAMASRRRK